jgi:hypothetical protein
VRKLTRLESLSVQLDFNAGDKCERFWSDADLAAIASLPSLREVLLSMTDMDLTALLALNGLRTVNDLCIRPGNVPATGETPELVFRGTGLRALRGLARLRSLDLAFTAVTDESLRFLQGVDSLRRLSLDETTIEGHELKYLTRLGQLESVSVVDTKVDDEAIMSLTELKSLRTLQVQRTRVTDAGVKRFNKARPDVLVIRTGPIRGSTQEKRFTKPNVYTARLADPSLLSLRAGNW